MELVMFLKAVKLKQLNSITARLTFFYSVATFTLLLVIALFLYGTTIHTLHRANSQFLSNEINILKNLLENKPKSHLALQQKVVEVPYAETGSVYHYFIRILNDKKKIELQTPGMKQALNNSGFILKPYLLEDQKIYKWRGKNSRQYVLMQAAANFNKSNHFWLIQVALDVSYQQKILHQYQLALVIVLLGGLLFAVIFGFIIAQRGLRSVNELTETTEKITANSLDRRIDPESWPKELKTLGIAFNRMLDRIETSFAYLTQFSADLAHELRTPVNNLMGETEIVLSRAHTIEDYQQVLTSNLEELQRISQIIENLLFLARADNHQLEIKKEILNVSHEIKCICEFYQAMADEKNIKIYYFGDALVKANPVMFRRMVSNILSNALKYTLPGGEVNFNIEITDDNLVNLVLKDSGVGIEKEHLSRIFNRFYRVDAARSPHSGGVGLGLAIVKSIVDLHQGIISIVSEMGEGTTVKVTLP